MALGSGLFSSIDSVALSGLMYYKLIGTMVLLGAVLFCPFGAFDLNLVPFGLKP